MKFSILALAATAFAVASAVDCDLTAIAPLITDPNVTTCTADSGFSFMAPTTPTGEMLTQICASSACQTVLTAVRALNLGDCTVLGIQLETDLLNPIAVGCAGSSASSTAGSSAGSSASSTATTAPTVGSTTAPAATTTTPSLGSSASSSTVNSPATPTPTTASAASSVSVAAATSAAVAAIAAAFL